MKEVSWHPIILDASSNIANNVNECHNPIFDPFILILW
jgi:hypothetical protein